MLANVSCLHYITLYYTCPRTLDKLNYIEIDAKKHKSEHRCVLSYDMFPTCEKYGVKRILVYGHVIQNVRKYTL